LILRFRCLLNLKRISTTLVALVLASENGSSGAEIFYKDDFSRPANRVGVTPSTNMGYFNYSAELTGRPVVVQSFGGLTNQCLLLQGSGYHGMYFEVGRGAPDYFLSFDFETHNLKASSASLCLSFWEAAFFMHGDGLFQCDAEGLEHFIGWTDDEPHHLLLAANFTNQTWTLQLDDKPPINGSLNFYGGDALWIGFELFHGDGNAEIAMDNVQIGTTTALFPLRTLHWFDGRDGTQPHSRLVYGGTGDFYGTTEGVPGYPGTAFKLKTSGMLEWTLHFSGINGDAPKAGLFLASDGFLYGTTSEGGKNGSGTAFKMTRNGELIWSVPFTGRNGSHPQSQLAEGLDGELYGTTPEGGSHDLGTIFRLSMRTRQIQVLHSFGGSADGASPYSRLTLVGDEFYGTTSSGGSFGGGTVFKIDRSGELTTMLSFDTTNGFSPIAGLTHGRDGSFYGTTAWGGTYGYGSIFRLSQRGECSLLYSFAGAEDGAAPQADLVLARDGWLYGVAELGGTESPNYFGTIFRVGTNGAFQKLDSFHGGDGSLPSGGLIEVERGKFYGTSQGGGSSPGNVFHFAVTRPKLVITSPKTHTRSAVADLIVSGKAKGDISITNLFYKVNEGAWLAATTTNSWTNWTASTVLAPGRNLFRAYAIDSLGDASLTNKLALFYLSPQ
jgi:uncharacterized repeat protein (TIGR03803 family)